MEASTIDSRNTSVHDDGKELILRSLPLILGFEEREPNERTRNAGQRELGHRVRQVPPVRAHIQDKEILRLHEPRHSELGLELGLNSAALVAFSDDGDDLLRSGDGLRRWPPDGVPVLRRRSGGTGADGFEYVLGPAESTRSVRYP